MNESAIKRIEQLECSDITRIDQTHVPVVVLPEGNQVEDLERYLENPLSQRVNYATERLTDFCNYAKKESKEGETAVFVEPDGSSAVAIIDFGTADNPKWKRHKAKLKMKWTPEFRAIHDICQRPVDQRQLTDFIEDWNHVLGASADGEPLGIDQAIKSIRAVTISNIREATSEVADFESSASALSKISAKSESGKLPGRLIMTGQVYPHTRTIDVHCRISIMTGSDKPMFRLRIVGLEKIEQEVAEEIEIEITQKLSGSARVFIGSVSS